MTVTDHDNTVHNDLVRRRLERWRRTGRIRGGQVCPVVAELDPAPAEAMLPPPSWWPSPILPEGPP